MMEQRMSWMSNAPFCHQFYQATSGTGFVLASAEVPDCVQNNLKRGHQLLGQHHRVGHYFSDLHGSGNRGEFSH